MTEEKNENTATDGKDATKEKPQFIMPDDTSAYALAERTVWHLLEKKGEDLVILDLRGRSDVCDFYVICTGNSANQVNALAKHTHSMLASTGHKPKGLEGMNDGRWALLDFFDVVVHIFKADVREYYNLERLWGDAPRVDLEPEHFFGPETGPAAAARNTDLNFTSVAGPDGTN